MDWYSAAYTVLLISFLECIIVGWIYGKGILQGDVLISEFDRNIIQVHVLAMKGVNMKQVSCSKNEDL